jgi:hypothetical protein
VTTSSPLNGPRSLQALQGFLGLTGYYCKFITGYSMVPGPLTTLLKREAIKWMDEAEEEFQLLKRALMTAPLLQIPNLDKRFINDCDMSGTGFGIVLHQGDNVIMYFSRPVAPHHQKLPAYEHKLTGLIKAMHHWWSYIWGRALTICTDHYSLKFQLDQRLSTTTGKYCFFVGTFIFVDTDEYKLIIFVSATSR